MATVAKAVAAFSEIINVYSCMYVTLKGTGIYVSVFQETLKDLQKEKGKRRKHCYKLLNGRCDKEVI